MTLKEDNPMNQDAINLHLPAGSIESIIAAHVQAAVLTALKPHGEELVQKLVEQALLQKSKHETYRYEQEARKPTVLEHLVKEIIAEEARKAIVAWVEGHREQIAEKIRKRMGSQQWASVVAKKIATDLSEMDFRFTLSVNPVFIEK